MKGTLLNTATVTAGASLGLLVGRAVPDTYQQIALSGLGLVTVGLGLRLFLQSKNVLIVAASIALGGILGLLLGLQTVLNQLAEWARQTLGGEGTFNEGLITASILFCIGPMTLLGCIKDGLEGDRELLNLKSTMDGVAAFFFAAALGVGVLVSAAVVFVFQGALTLAARPLRPLADDRDMIAEVSAAGGTMMLAIGLGLLEIKRLPIASYLPALVLAPIFVLFARKLEGRRDASG